MTMDELKAEMESRLSSAASHRPPTAAQRAYPGRRGGLANTFERLYRRLGLSG